MNGRLLGAVVICGLSVSPARSQSLDKEMPALAESLSKGLLAQGHRSAAAVDFTDLQGKPTELGRYLAERLVVELVAGGRIAVADRANIRSILAEHKLTEAGLVNPANAKKLGQFAGVDVILTGNVTAVDAGWELIVKAISTETAKVAAAGRITFPRTKDNQEAAGMGVFGGLESPPMDGGRPGLRYEDTGGAASKDLGPLRVILKSVLPVRQRGANGQMEEGVRCSFELLNRETQRTIWVAMNATPAPPERLGAYGGSTGQCRLIGNVPNGEILRTTLAEESGVVWRLPTTGVTGVSVISAGKRDPCTAFTARDVPQLLLRQDRTGTNMTTDEGNLPRGPFAFVWGTADQLTPGQRAAITLTFVPESRETASTTEKTFQLVSELIIGTETDRKRTYSLQTLVFDRVGISGSK